MEWAVQQFQSCLHQHQWSLIHGIEALQHLCTSRLTRRYPVTYRRQRTGAHEHRAWHAVFWIHTFYFEAHSVQPGCEQHAQLWVRFQGCGERIEQEAASIYDAGWRFGFVHALQVAPQRLRSLFSVALFLTEKVIPSLSSTYLNEELLKSFQYLALLYCLHFWTDRLYVYFFRVSHDCKLPISRVMSIPTVFLICQIDLAKFTRICMNNFLQLLPPWNSCHFIRWPYFFWSKEYLFKWGCHHQVRILHMLFSRSHFPEEVEWNHMSFFWVFFYLFSCFTPSSSQHIQW